MNLKKRLNAIDGKLNPAPDPKEEARNQELGRLIKAGRKRVNEYRANAGLPLMDFSDRPIFDVKPGASLPELMNAAREAHIAREARLRGEQ